MKTIIYSLIAIFVFGIVAMSFIKKSNHTEKILLQSTDSNISSVSLSQSAEIISKRLKSYSSEKFELTTIPDKHQIKVVLIDKWDLETTKNLITQKGAIEFYEAYLNLNLPELLKGDATLLSLIERKALPDSSVKIGCTTPTGIIKVNLYLKAAEPNQNYKLVWGSIFENTEHCLYALKLNHGNGVLLKGTDIESFKLNQENYIEFKFKKSAIDLWSAITKHNINSPIALVLDDNVIFAPLVRQAIDGGNCVISGDFTPTQLKYIASIGSNGELSANFEIVK